MYTLCRDVRETTLLYYSKPTVIAMTWCLRVGYPEDTRLMPEDIRWTPGDAAVRWRNEICSVLARRDAWRVLDWCITMGCMTNVPSNHDAIFMNRVDILRWFEHVGMEWKHKNVCRDAIGCYSHDVLDYALAMGCAVTPGCVRLANGIEDMEITLRLFSHNIECTPAEERGLIKIAKRLGIPYKPKNVKYVKSPRP